MRYLFLPREHKIHIFEPTCNGLFVIWRLNIEYFRFYCVPSQVLQIQLGFYIANRKTKVLGAKYIETLNQIKQKLCELMLDVNTEKNTDFDLNHQIQ